MRKGKVVNLKGFRFLKFFADNNILVIIVFLFIAGIAIGTFSFSKIEALKTYSSEYLKSFIELRSHAEFLSVAVDSFASSLLVLLVVFASGASMLGIILVPFFITLRGILYGGVTAVLYADYAIKGIAFNAVIIIPSSLFFIIALILASRESIQFSLVITRLSLPRTSPANLSADFRNYCGRYLFICVIVLASAVTDAVLSCSFMSSFNL